MMSRSVAWGLALALLAGCANSGSRIADPLRAAKAGRIVRAIQLPTLMTDELHTSEQLCEHARRHHPEMSLALVAIKSHVCDFGTRACLKATRDLADTCNTFIQSNFALYQSRLYRNSPDGEVVMQEDPSAWEIADEWSHTGPLLVIVDLSSCTRSGEVAAVTGGMSEVDPQPELPTLARFEATRDAVMRLPVVAVRLSARQRQAGFDPACLAQPEPSVMAVWTALEHQAGEVQHRAAPGLPPSY